VQKLDGFASRKARFFELIRPGKACRNYGTTILLILVQSRTFDGHLVPAEHGLELGFVLGVAGPVSAHILLPAAAAAAAAAVGLNNRDVAGAAAAAGARTLIIDCVRDALAELGVEFVDHVFDIPAEGLARFGRLDVHVARLLHVVGVDDVVRVDDVVPISCQPKIESNLWQLFAGFTANLN